MNKPNNKVADSVDKWIDFIDSLDGDDLRKHVSYGDMVIILEAIRNDSILLMEYVTFELDGLTQDFNDIAIKINKLASATASSSQLVKLPKKMLN